MGATAEVGWTNLLQIVMITRSEEINESPGGELSIEFYLEMAADKFLVKAHQRTMTHLGISIVCRGIRILRE